MWKKKKKNEEKLFLVKSCVSFKSEVDHGRQQMICDQN